MDVAERFLKKADNFDEGLVLFKPTLTSEIPFRTTLEGALSYFVGENDDFPEDIDNGFALKPWESIAFDFVGIIFDENRAILQTKTDFTASGGSVTTAYFSMSLTRSSKRSNLKIELHLTPSFNSYPALFVNYCIVDVSRLSRGVNWNNN